MGKQFYVYLYLRKDGRPYYVGKGSGTRVLYSYKYSRSVQKPSDPNRIIVLNCNSESEAFATEIKLIQKWGRLDLGTGCLRNHTNGGEGPSGRICSEEHKRRISIANTGRKRSESSKEKMRNAHLGHKLSDQAKKKLSLAFKGRVLSEEHKRKIGEANSKSLLGKTLTQEHRNKIGRGLRAAYVEGRRHRRMNEK